MSAPLKLVGAVVVVLALIAAVAVAAAVQPLRQQSELASLGSLDVEYVLLPVAFDSLGALGVDYGVASTGAVFLRTSGGLAAIESGGGPEEMEMAQPVDSLAVGQDDAMLTVAHGFLGVLGEDQRPVEGTPLPYEGARVAPSAHAGAVYLYGGGIGDFRLYRFFSDGTYELLARSKDPIVAVADTLSMVVVATPGRVVKLTSAGAQVLFQAPEDTDFPPIVSVAAAPDGLLFVSTARRVYAALGGDAFSIVGDSGGQLRWRNGRLYVLDPVRRLLYILQPASRTMFQSAVR